jgi:F-type H+-transporting ATPase subunit c
MRKGEWALDLSKERSSAVFILNSFLFYYMEPETLRIVMKGATMALGGIFPALAIGKIVAKAMESIGRNPESSGKLFVPMLLGAAMAEAIAFLALVVAFTL